MHSKSSAFGGSFSPLTLPYLPYASSGRIDRRIQGQRDLGEDPGGYTSSLSPDDIATLMDHIRFSFIHDGLMQRRDAQVRQHTVRPQGLFLRQNHPPARTPHCCGQQMPHVRRACCDHQLPVGGSKAWHCVCPRPILFLSPTSLPDPLSPSPTPFPPGTASPQPSPTSVSHLPSVEPTFRPQHPHDIYAGLCWGQGA